MLKEDHVRKSGDYLDNAPCACKDRSCVSCLTLRPWRKFKRRTSLPQARCLLCGRFAGFYFGLNGWAGLFAQSFPGALAFRTCQACCLRLVLAAGLPDPRRFRGAGRA